MASDGRAISAAVHETVEASAPSGNRIVLHVPSGTYLKLDPTAAAIVDLLRERATVSSAAEALARQFDIPLDRARSDVASVANTLTGLRASRSSRARTPTLSGLLACTRSWWAMSPSVRWLVVRVTGVVIATEIGLRTIDIQRLAGLMKVPLASETADVPEDRPDESAGCPLANRRLSWPSGGCSIDGSFRRPASARPWSPVGSFEVANRCFGWGWSARGIPAMPGSKPTG